MQSDVFSGSQDPAGAMPLGVNGNAVIYEQKNMCPRQQGSFERRFNALLLK